MKTRIIIVLIVLTVLFSSILGCSPKKDSYLVEIMKILPQDTPRVSYMDVELMAEDPDLEDLYSTVQESWDDYLGYEANILCAIDFNHVSAFAITDSIEGYLIAIKGEFDVRDVRDALLEEDFMQGEYEGVEVWTDDSRQAFALLKKIIVSGDANVVETSIRASQNDEPSMYGNNDIKSTIDKLPTGFYAQIWTAERLSFTRALKGGICLRKGEGVIEIKGCFIFESETAAEAALPDLEDAMRGFLGATFIEGQLRGQFIELTGEMAIPD